MIEMINPLRMLHNINYIVWEQHYQAKITFEIKQVYILKFVSLFSSNLSPYSGMFYFVCVSGNKRLGKRSGGGGGVEEGPRNVKITILQITGN
jgi:hypothetical protein